MSALELPPIVAGDSYPLVFRFVVPGVNTPISQVGNTLTLTVKRRRGAPAPLLERTVTGEGADAEAGLIRVPLTDAETLAWRGFGSVFVHAQHNANGTKRSPLLVSLPVLDPA